MMTQIVVKKMINTQIFMIIILKLHLSILQYIILFIYK